MTELAIKIVNECHQILRDRIDYYKNVTHPDWSMPWVAHAIGKMLENVEIHRAGRNRVVATINEPTETFIDPIYSANLLNNSHRKRWAYLVADMFDQTNQDDPNFYRRAEIRPIGKYTVEMTWV